MKPLIIAITVFLLICVSVVWLDIYIEKTCAKLTALSDALPETLESESEFNTALDNFNLAWSKCSTVFDLTIGHEETKEIDEALGELTVRYSQGDTPGYMTSRHRLTETITDLLETEAFTLRGIF